MRTRRRQRNRAKLAPRATPRAIEPDVSLAECSRERAGCPVCEEREIRWLADACPCCTERGEERDAYAALRDHDRRLYDAGYDGWGVGWLPNELYELGDAANAAARHADRADYEDPRRWGVCCVCGEKAHEGDCPPL